MQDFPENMNFQGLLGANYSVLGERDAAMAIVEKLEDMEAPYSYGNNNSG